MASEKIKLTDEDLELLNSKIGLKHLFANNKINLSEALRLSRYEVKLRSMQEKLVHLQNWVIKTGQRIIILFEGRDAAGKGGAIRRVTAHINPRHYRIIALPKPTAEEKGQWYFQRYVNNLPKPGEIVFFDRSWYNRAVVEPVNDFCTKEEYNVFMTQVNGFENMLVESGAYLVKMYFSITKEEQARRFADIKKSPLKRWKLSEVDLRAQELWPEYTKYKKRMFDKTDTDTAPWKIIAANIKSDARLTAIKYLLDVIPYEQIPAE